MSLGLTELPTDDTLEADPLDAPDFVEVEDLPDDLVDDFDAVDGALLDFVDVDDLAGDVADDRGDDLTDDFVDDLAADIVDDFVDDFADDFDFAEGAADTSELAFSLDTCGSASGVSSNTRAETRQLLLLWRRCTRSPSRTAVITVCKSRCSSNSLGERRSPHPRRGHVVHDPLESGRSSTA